MSYWSGEPEGNDYASTSVGAVIYWIKQRMMDDMDAVQKEQYPEQNMIAYLICLRLLGERFPKALRVHFRKKHLGEVRSGFEQWYAAVKSKLPSKYRDQILANANDEFALFEEQIRIVPS